MLIFAGLRVSTQSVSGEGSFLSSVHSELRRGAVPAGGCVGVAVLLLMCQL